MPVGILVIETVVGTNIILKLQRGRGSTRVHGRGKPRSKMNAVLRAIKDAKDKGVFQIDSPGPMGPARTILDDAVSVVHSTFFKILQFLAPGIRI